MAQISSDFIYGHRFRDLAKARGYYYARTELYKEQGFFGLMICHNSDKAFRTAPEGYLMVYSTNVDVVSDQVEPIPLGIKNPGWHPESLDMLRREQEKDISKAGLLYIHHNTATNLAERVPPYEMFAGVPWATVRAGLADYPTYLRGINSHRFVLCPEGNGMDTYRMWESLYLGAIPIVKRRVFTEEFAKILPILVVDNWKEVVFQRLEEAWNKLRGMNRDALAFSWWEKKI